MSEIPVYEAATAPPPKRLTPDEMEILQLCNFERYRDLVDKRRLGVSERDHLDQLDDWWDRLFDRKSLPPTESPAQQAHAAVGYTYEGTLTVEGETEAKPAKAGKRGLDLETVSEETLLSKVASLGKEDRDRLDKMAEDFSIQGYCHLLDILRREDDEIKRNQDAIDRKKKIPKKVRRRMRDREGKARSSHRSGSPSYDAMGYEVITILLVFRVVAPSHLLFRLLLISSPRELSSDSEDEAANSGDEGDQEKKAVPGEANTASEFITEFSAGSPRESGDEVETGSSEPFYMRQMRLDKERRAKEKGESQRQQQLEKSKMQKVTTPEQAATPPKALTPMEKLKLKMQQQFTQSVEGGRNKQEQRRKDQLLLEAQAAELEKADSLKRSARRSPSSSPPRSDEQSRSRSRSRGARSRSRSRSRSDSRSKRKRSRSHSRRRSRSRHRRRSPRSRSRSRSQPRNRSRDRDRQRRRRSRSRTRSRSRSRTRRSRSRDGRRKNDR